MREAKAGSYQHKGGQFAKSLKFVQGELRVEEKGENRQNAVERKEKGSSDSGVASQQREEHSPNKQKYGEIWQEPVNMLPHMN